MAVKRPVTTAMRLGQDQAPSFPTLVEAITFAKAVLGQGSKQLLSLTPCFNIFASQFSTTQEETIWNEAQEAVAVQECYQAAGPRCKIPLTLFKQMKVKKKAFGYYITLHTSSVKSMVVGAIVFLLPYSFLQANTLSIAHTYIVGS